MHASGPPVHASGPLASFVAANRRLSRRIERRLPHARPRLQGRYARTVARYADARRGQRVVDLGAGRTSHFVHRCDPARGAHVVGVDISASELAHNRDVHERHVIAAGGPLPFADGSVDLLVSRSVLEHVAGLPHVLTEVHRVLAPGARTIHVFPCRNAPFAAINRLLPRAVSGWLLRTCIPGSDGRLGFPAFYEHCTPAAMEALLRAHGFEVLRTEVSYYQSDYYGSLVPLFLLSAAYELVIRALGRRELAATVLIVARKPA